MLVLHRADATVIPLELSRDLAASLPDARLELLPGTSASLFFEDPEGVADRIAAFAAAPTTAPAAEPAARTSRRPATKATTPAGAGGLSPRELEVLALIAHGETNAEIAADLGISVNTVERHASTSTARSMRAAAPTPRRGRCVAVWRERTRRRLTGIRDRRWSASAMTGSRTMVDAEGMEQPATTQPDPTPAPSLMHRVSLATMGLARPLAGRRVLPLWAVLEHRGRSSGTVRRTPVVALRTGDGFMIPMPFGPSTQWTQNVIAAGEATLTWKGRDGACRTRRSPGSTTPPRPSGRCGRSPSEPES